MGRRNRIVRRSSSRHKASRYKRQYRPPKIVEYVKRTAYLTGRLKERAKAKREKPLRIVGYESSGEPIWGT